MVADWADSGSLSRLAALELVEIDVAAGEYRLDDRAERFLEEMLGASEVAQADWLVGLLEEIRRNIDGYQHLSDPHKGAGLLRRICRLLHACKTRSQRHLEEVKAAVDYDYRAGSDYEVKLLRLKWHLERTRSYGKAIDELSTLLRQDTFSKSIRSWKLSRCGGRCCVPARESGWGVAPMAGRLVGANAVSSRL